MNDPTIAGGGLAGAVPAQEMNPEDPAQQEQPWHDSKDPLQLTAHPNPMINRKGVPYTSVWSDPRHIPLDAFKDDEDEELDDADGLFPPGTVLPPESYLSPEEAALFFPEDEEQQPAQDPTSDQADSEGRAGDKPDNGG